MKKKIVIFGGILCFISANLEAQNLGINATGNTPQESAGLDIDFNNKGLLMPRLTTEQRNAIINPVESLMIYNTDTRCYEGYMSDIGVWRPFGCLECPIVDAPEATTESAITQEGFTANWEAVPDATEYFLDVSTEINFSSFNTGYENVSVGSNLYSNVSGLTCNTIYYYRVRAYNECGVSTNSDVISVATQPCPIDCGSPFVDIRDNNTYQTVLLGNKCWMAENLRYLPTVSPTSAYSNTEPQYQVFGYNGTDVDEAKLESTYTAFGVLYNWPAATGGVNSATNPSNVQGACPNGWHIPSSDEWCDMVNAEEPSPGMNCNAVEWNGFNIGKYLKDDVTWDGDNSTGFTGIASGYGGSAFGGNGMYAGYWTTTVSSGAYHWRYIIQSGYNGINRYCCNADYTGWSVRCVKD